MLGYRAALLLCLASALIVRPALADSPSTQIEVSAGPLPQVLLEIARQTNVQLLFDASRLAGLRAPKLDEHATAMIAIRQAIANTDLKVREMDSSTFIIEFAAATPLARQDVAVSEVLVIGRRTQNADIRRLETDIQPYQVTTGAELAESHRDNIDQYFNSRVPSNTEFPGAPSATAYNSGATNSEIDLRGLGPDQTLVLIDGRPMPGLPAAEFGFLQPDLNAIPLHAVDRIEVLTGTAGGIYGFGALGGVVNVVLAHDRPGAEAYLTEGISSRGYGARQALEARLEFSPDQGQTDVSFDGSFTNAQPLTVGEAGDLARDRQVTDQVDPQILTYDFLHGNGVGVFNFYPDLVLKPQFGGAALPSTYTYLTNSFAGGPQALAAALAAHAGLLNLGLSAGEASSDLGPYPQTDSVLMNVRHDFGGDVEAYFDGIMLWNHGQYVDRSPGVTDFLPASSPYNPFTTDVLVSLPVSGASLGRQSSFDSGRYTVGAISPIPFGWRATAEATLGFADYEMDEDDRVVLTGSPLANINPFGPWAQVQHGLSSEITDSTFRLRAANLYTEQSLRLAGPVFNAPGGPATLTLLAQHQTQDVPGYDSSATGDLSGYDLAIAPRTTDTTSVYAELRSRLFGETAPSPLLRDLELQLAVRDDIEANSFTTDPILAGSPRMHATFAGAAFTAGAKTSPLTWLTLRASYATGETPPPLQDLVEVELPNSSVFAPDPQRGGSLLSGGENVLVKSGGSPNLGLVLANTISAGVILTPLGSHGPRLSLDYSRISKTYDVLLLSPEIVLEHAAYWLWRIQRGPLTAADQALGYTGGPITEIDATAINGASLLVQTVDARLDWTMSLPIGGLHIYGAATYHFDDTEGGLFQANVQTAGYVNSPLVWRANAGADWSWGTLTIGANVQYFGRYYVYPAADDAFIDGLDAAVQGSDDVPAQTYIDLRISERFPLPRSGFAKNLEVDFGVENLFDTAPPRVTAVGINAPSYSQFGDPLRRRFELVLSSRF